MSVNFSYIYVCCIYAEIFEEMNRISFSIYTFISSSAQYFRNFLGHCLFSASDYWCHVSEKTDKQIDSYVVVLCCLFFDSEFR